MAILDPFSVDAFSLVSLTGAINRVPNMYGRLREMNLFTPDPVTTRTVVVEMRDGVLHLLKTMPVGSPGQKNLSGTRSAKSFVIPHIPHDDVIYPQEYDSIRAFGTENRTEALSDIMMRKLMDCANNHYITHEYLRMGALKGIVYDSDLSVIYNWYTEFAITQKVVDFVLGTDGTDVAGKCLEVVRHIETNLKGEVKSGIHALVDSSFMDKLKSHPQVVDYYKIWEAGTVLREDTRKGFYYNGITFEEYNGTATTSDGVVRNFISTDDGYAFPIGTQTTFKFCMAPADFLETVNTPGKLMYAKRKIRDFERGVDIHTQSNPLPMVTRPEVVVRIHTSN